MNDSSTQQFAMWGTSCLNKAFGMLDGGKIAIFLIGVVLLNATEIELAVHM